MLAQHLLFDLSIAENKYLLSEKQECHVIMWWSTILCLEHICWPLPYLVMASLKVCIPFGSVGCLPSKLSKLFSSLVCVLPASGSNETFVDKVCVCVLCTHVSSSMPWFVLSE